MEPLSERGRKDQGCEAAEARSGKVFVKYLSGRTPISPN